MRTSFSRPRRGVPIALLPALITALFSACAVQDATPDTVAPLPIRQADGATLSGSTVSSGRPGSTRPQASQASQARLPLATSPIPVKVMIVTMFAPEAKPWLDHLGATTAISIPGLSPEFPTVQCHGEDVCVVTTGMGHTNAAASMAALLFSGRFDLRQTYFVIGGIAGIDPAQGTLGTVAWARYLVDFGLQWELDAREIPKAWSSGYLGIHTASGAEKPKLHYGTEVYQLNEALLQRALTLSKAVSLTDSAAAQSYRAKYAYAPANQPPRVTQCDTTSGDTWFSGTALGNRARTWTSLLTDGKGVYCTTQQEDNATFEVIKRAATAGLADTNRVAVMRAGSDFDRPPKGVSNVENLFNYPQQGGFQPAIANLYLSGSPLVQQIVTHWSEWQKGVPVVSND